MAGIHLVAVTPSGSFGRRDWRHRGLVPRARPWDHAGVGERAHRNGGVVMDLATLVMWAIQASVCLIVFSLGLGSTQEDALYLLRRPRLLVRSLLSMNVVMPLVAAGLAAVFNFP